jgi:hypothetical protein
MRTLTGIIILVAIQVFTAQAHALADEGPQGMSVSYSWQLSEADTVHLLNGVKSLRYGDSITAVKTILGNPTKERNILDKKTRKFKTHELLYAIKRVEPEGGNVKDQEITLNFDIQGRLRQIDYNAMPPLFGEVIFSGSEPLTGTEFYLTKPPKKADLSQ